MLRLFYHAFHSELSRSLSGTATPPSLYIWARSPEGKGKRITVTVEGDNCEALLEAARRQLAEVSVGESLAIYTHEVTYNRYGEERGALRCFDKKKNDNSYIDAQDGSVVHEESFLRSSLRFLRPASPLPSSPSRLPPVIIIETEVELLSAASDGQLQPAPPNSLSDSSYAAFLRGVRSGERLFWQLQDSWNYVSAESDETFELEKIPGGPKKNFIFALLRDGDLIPAANVPENRVLEVHRRAGIELRVEGGRVRCTGSPEPADIDLWSRPRKADAFLKDFAAAARK